MNSFHHIFHHTKIRINSLLLSIFLPLFFFLYGPSQQANAEWIYEKEQLLVQITTDLNSDIFPMQIFTDQNGNIVGGKVNQDLYPADTFIDKIHQGLTLSEHKRTRVVILEGPHLNASTGGEMELFYLNDIFFKKYRKFKMSLERVNDQWALYTQSPQGTSVKISNLHIKIRSFFGLSIGIKQIIVNR